MQLFTTAGIKTRELIVQIVQTQLKEAGFDVPDPQLLAPRELFPGHILPGNYNMLLVGRRVASFYPESCGLFCSNAVRCLTKFGKTVE